MQRPPRSIQKTGQADSPRSLRIACVVSTIISNRSEPFSRPSAGSIASSKCASAAICSGITTLGSVTTKLAGRRPPVASHSALTKRSSVRMLRSRNSGENGLIRMPINGGSESFAETLGHFLGGELRVLVLLRIGTVSVAVLEVDAEILDRLAPQFFQHAAVNRQRHPGRAIFHASIFQATWRIAAPPRQACLPDFGSPPLPAIRSRAQK